jgi:hypothetical protein
LLGGKNIIIQNNSAKKRRPTQRWERALRLGKTARQPAAGTGRLGKTTRQSQATAPARAANNRRELLTAQNGQRLTHQKSPALPDALKPPNEKS